jgi:hypothetical protein
LPNTTQPAPLQPDSWLPVTGLDRPAGLKQFQDQMMTALNPSCPVSQSLALDITGIETDIRRLRQAKADVIDQALHATLRTMLATNKLGSYFVREVFKFEASKTKLISDVLRGRPGIQRRLAIVLNRLDETPETLRAKVYFRHMEVTQKIDQQLDRLERRRRSLTKDLELYQSARAKLIVADDDDE